MAKRNRVIKKQEIKLGEVYVEKATKIEGTATVKAEYLNGSSRVMLEWINNGEHQESWFDVGRLSPKK